MQTVAISKYIGLSITAALVSMFEIILSCRRFWKFSKFKFFFKLPILNTCDRRTNGETPADMYPAYA